MFSIKQMPLVSLALAGLSAAAAAQEIVWEKAAPTRCQASCWADREPYLPLDLSAIGRFQVVVETLGAEDPYTRSQAFVNLETKCREQVRWWGGATFGARLVVYETSPVVLDRRTRSQSVRKNGKKREQSATQERASSESLVIRAQESTPGVCGSWQEIRIPGRVPPMPGMPGSVFRP